jgi:hypothetical protein
MLSWLEQQVRAVFRMLSLPIQRTIHHNTTAIIMVRFLLHVLSDILYLALQNLAFVVQQLENCLESVSYRPC